MGIYGAYVGLSEGSKCEGMSGAVRALNRIQGFRAYGFTGSIGSVISHPCIYVGETGGNL